MLVQTGRGSAEEERLLRKVTYSGHTGDTRKVHTRILPHAFSPTTRLIATPPYFSFRSSEEPKSMRPVYITTPQPLVQHAHHSSSSHTSTIQTYSSKLILLLFQGSSPQQTHHALPPNHRPPPPRRGHHPRPHRPSPSRPALRQPLRRLLHGPELLGHGDDAHHPRPEQRESQVQLRVGAAVAHGRSVPL